MEDASLAVKVAGAVAGVLTLKGLPACISVGQLRAEVCRAGGLDAVRLIVAGRHLADDSRTLAECGIGEATRVLVTRAAAPPGAAAAEERAARLDKLRRAAGALAARDSRGLTDEWALSLEDQNGTQLALPEQDRQALVLGLALHSAGRASMARGCWADALGQLLAAEEALGMVEGGVLERVDNPALVALDAVWCCFKLQDASRLGVSAQRLARARAGLERAHGPDQARLRVLHGNFRPEVATYVRLETLEGVVAFHAGDHAVAARHLVAAQALWQSLQVDDAALAQLQEISLATHREATRALRFCSGDVAAATEFVAQQRARAEERRAQRLEQRAWHHERSRYGKTSGGNYVDISNLKQLESLGYERALAAEALRVCENDANAALDVLSDIVRRGALQLAMAAAEALERTQGPRNVDAEALQKLLEMGFVEVAARRALHAAGDELEAALAALQEQGAHARVDGAEPSTISATGGGGGDGDGAGQGAAARAGGASSSRGTRRQRPPRRSASEEALENELTQALHKDDPLSAYDVSVEEEGEAIQTYQALISAAAAERRA